jgi:hypothetical protein
VTHGNDGLPRRTSHSRAFGQLSIERSNAQSITFSLVTLHAWDVPWTQVGHGQTPALNRPGGIAQRDDEILENRTTHAAVIRLPPRHLADDRRAKHLDERPGRLETRW